jgi:hypothetical protein
MSRTPPKYDADQVRRLSDTTIAYYDRSARAFWDGTRHHDVSQNYAAFLDAIEGNPPYSILDLGCGPAAISAISDLWVSTPWGSTGRSNSLRWRASIRSARFCIRIFWRCNCLRAALCQRRTADHGSWRVTQQTPGLPIQEYLLPPEGQQPAHAVAAPAASQAGCHAYTIALTVGGRPEQATLEACPQSDGSWRITQSTPGLPLQTYLMPPPPPPDGRFYASAYPDFDEGFDFDPYWADTPWFFGLGPTLVVVYGFNHFHHGYVGGSHGSGSARYPPSDASDGPRSGFQRSSGGGWPGSGFQRSGGFGGGGGGFAGGEGGGFGRARR